MIPASYVCISFFSDVTEKEGLKTSTASKTASQATVGKQHFADLFSNPSQ